MKNKTYLNLSALKCSSFLKYLVNISYANSLFLIVAIVSLINELKSVEGLCSNTDEWSNRYLSHSFTKS
jgi:hypothetical protein